MMIFSSYCMQRTDPVCPVSVIVFFRLSMSQTCNELLLDARYFWKAVTNHSQAVCYLGCYFVFRGYSGIFSENVSSCLLTVLESRVLFIIFRKSFHSVRALALLNPNFN